MQAPEGDARLADDGHAQVLDRTSTPLRLPGVLVAVGQILPDERWQGGSAQSWIAGPALQPRPAGPARAAAVDGRSLPSPQRRVAAVGLSHAAVLGAAGWVV